MEAPEVPLEHAQETIEHRAHGATEPWIMGVALTAAVLAVLAALTALLAEHHANEAMITRIEAADKWNEYQADSAKQKIIQMKLILLAALGKQPAADDRDNAAKVAKYEEDKPKIKEEALEKEQESKGHLLSHEPLSRGITMFQVAIAVGAISVLTRRKAFWFVSIGFGVVGVIFLILGLLP